MLVNSGSVRGKCPVCGAANCSCGGPTTVDEAPQKRGITEGVMGGSDMVVIPTGKAGVGIKLTRAQAVARGLLPAEEKAQKPAQNKKRLPAQNKGK